MVAVIFRIIQQCRKCKVVFVAQRLLFVCQRKRCGGFMSGELPESVLENAVEISEKDMDYV